MEGGEEGPGLHLERPLRDLLDSARDAESVKLPERKRFEDQQIERALEQVGGLRRHLDREKAGKDGLNYRRPAIVL
jgi:hypothetical protein